MWSDEKTLLSADFASKSPSSVGSASSKKRSGVPEREPESRRLSGVVMGPSLLASDRFIEREVIGEGGMSLVIRAFDTLLQRDVALKVLPRDGRAGKDGVARLAEEARITGRLEHPNIVPVHDFGIDERGARFLCMKLVLGETLEDTLSWAGAGRLEPDFLADLLDIFGKVCDAVAFAHSRGVLHRDLKPSNIMISDFGQVYVVDWGVARVTPRFANGLGCTGTAAPADAFGLIVGTPRYMAPEQLRGLHDELDERTDVFALGATLYQILTGQPPHDPESLPDIALCNASVAIRPPEELVEGIAVPAELSRIALKALSNDPDDRYATVDDLKRDIERFQRGTWHLPRKLFSAGSIIVAEGEEGDSAFIIVEGRCVAFGKDGSGVVRLREMGPGDVFGETAVVSNKRRTATVRALTDVAVMIVTADALSGALGLNRWMGTFVKALTGRFRELDERLRDLELRARPTQPPPGE
jgi:eukaryotic-like serine/threonine-protein kinase